MTATILNFPSCPLTTDRAATLLTRWLSNWPCRSAAPIPDADPTTRHAAIGLAAATRLDVARDADAAILDLCRVLDDTAIGSRNYRVAYNAAAGSAADEAGQEFLADFFDQIERDLDEAADGPHTADEIAHADACYSCAYFLTRDTERLSAFIDRASDL